MTDKLIIKKYNNRRLYDTEKNSYVTLSQVSDVIKQGRQVEVVDAKTKEDVTAFILTQVLLEEAKNKNFLLPVPILHLMIQFGETVLNEFFEKHLQQIIKNYLAFKTSVDQQFEKWLDLSVNLADDAKKSLPSLSPLKSIFDLMTEPVEQEKTKNKRGE
ncbi:MAG TPA: polyhydroxyalkanoate synthesis regulator DNA-binding domain-containing protein [Syntrophales bacterium]|nr:polyhydroxyalkanoate synthesis regulator DNA-binding domain-containing protein [Syntrophales bacterium]